MKAVYDLFQRFSGQWQSQIKHRACTCVDTVYQKSYAFLHEQGQERNHTNQVIRWETGMTLRRCRRRAKGWLPSWRHTVLSVGLPFSRHSDAPRGWQAPTLHEGNSLSVGWEKKFKSLPCVLRENKNLSVCVYEKISHFIPAGGEKREKKHTLFLARLEVVCAHRLGL